MRSQRRRHRPCDQAHNELPLCQNTASRRTNRPITRNTSKMLSPHPSSAEARLETQRLGSLQLRVAFLCTLAQMFDGYDITSIGMAVPSLSAAWHIPGAAFANTFVMSSVGIMVGALLSGPAGDRPGQSGEEVLDKSLKR